MDPKIENLSTTTFSGRRFTRKQISLIQKTCMQFGNLSRRELTHTVCELLEWHTPSGDNKVHACAGMLESLEEHGVVSLPEKDKARKGSKPKPIAQTKKTDEPSEIKEELKDLTPIRLQVVTEKDDAKLWDEYIDRYHYLGFKRPIGPHLRYFIVDRNNRKLGCLMFSYPVKTLPCRDEWIGWQDTAYKKHLHLIVNNNRFLIFPWVQVKCLASKALSLATRQLADDWNQRYGYKPVLVETFVDRTRYEGSSYTASNWKHLGETNGRKETKSSPGKAPKAVYIYELTDNARLTLVNGPAPSLKPTKRKVQSTPSSPLTSTDPFVQVWQKIIQAITEVSQEFDERWQQRKRVLNSLLIMLFIFRLVLSQNKQGYAITISELWDQCRTMNIPLPQAKPVAPSAFSKARSKLDEVVFKMVQAEILRNYNKSSDTHCWHQHKVYAVDGSRLNLPRQLIDYGFQIPSDNAYYPQGLVSCLYQLKSKIPIDFELVSHSDERRLALSHLEVVDKNGVIVYDRGYYSYEMLYEHCRRGIHPVFRLKNKASSTVDKFIAGQETDKIIQIKPSPTNKKELSEKYVDYNSEKIAFRLVRYTVSGTTYILGTTLLDQERYPINELSDLYHARWGVEELYKISKQLTKVEDFHAHSERGVKQELYAHFNLITLTRIFSNHSEDEFNKGKSKEKAPIVQANFKHSLATVARNIESLLLQQAKLITDTVNKIVSCIANVRQKQRPNRSYDRRSRKPIGKWKPPKMAKKHQDNTEVAAC